MKAQVHLRTIPDGEMFQTKVKKIKTRFMLRIFPPPAIVPLWDNVEKYGKDDNIIRHIFMQNT